MEARSNVYSFSEIIILVGKLHLKQNSLNKLLATVHGFVCSKCSKYFAEMSYLH